MTRSPQLPVGTQVVLRRRLLGTDGGPVQQGATGRVIAYLDDGRYAVELANGRQLACRREEVSLRGLHQRDLALGTPALAVAPHDLVAHHTIYAAVVGSRAFGLADDQSDTDIRGVYVAPTPMFWSLTKPPMHVDGPGAERVSWEIERFGELALKANPNLLEVLHSPLVETLTPLGAELLDLRDAFLSQLVYQTYQGYVLSQFKKIETDLRVRGAPKWKHVMHLLRLLLSARDLLASGVLTLDVGAERDRLLAVRRGELAWDEVDAWRLALHAELDAVLPTTPLPAGPDVARFAGWLYDVRARSAREAL